MIDQEFTTEEQVPQEDILVPEIMPQQADIDETGYVNPVDAPSWREIYQKTGITPDFSADPSIETKSDWDAALELDNNFVSWMADVENAPEGFDKVDPEYDGAAYANAMPNLDESDRMDVINARNAGEADWIIGNKRRQRANYQQLAEAGFLKSTTMSVGAALLDPVSWLMAPIPLLKGAQIGTNIVRGGAIGAADYALSETMLHGTQSERDLTESLYGFGPTIGFGMVLGGWAGRAAAREVMAGMSEEALDTSGGKFFADVEYKQAPSDISGLPRNTNPEYYSVETKKPYLKNVPMERQDELMRMHRDKELTTEELDRALTDEAIKWNTLIAEPVTNIVKKITPATHIAHSMNYILREAGEELSESSLLKKYHTAGIGGKQAIDTDIEMATQQEVAQILDYLNTGYEAYLGTSNPFKKAAAQFGKGNLNHTQFSEEVFKSIVSGGKYGNKHVREAAANINKINESFEKDMVDLKILAPENYEEGMALTREINELQSTANAYQKKMDTALDQVEKLEAEIAPLRENIAKMMEAETARGKPFTARKLKQKRDLMAKLERRQATLEKKKGSVLDAQEKYDPTALELEAKMKKMDDFTYSPTHGVGGTDKWYIPHIFRGQHVMDNYDEFMKRTVDDIKAQLKENAENPVIRGQDKADAVADYEHSLTPEGSKEISDAMERTYDKITKSHTGQVSATLGGANRFKAQRKLTVRTEALIGNKDAGDVSFIETDVANVFKQHRRAMVPHAITKARGWDVEAKITQANELRKKMNEYDPKNTKKNNADFKAVANKLRAMDSMVHNIYPAMNPVFNSMNSAKEIIMNWNVMRSLGSMPISAIPDLGNVISRIGLGQISTNMVRMATHPSAMKIGMKATRKLYLVNERMLASKMAQLMATDDMAPNMSAAGRTTHRWATKFITATGMNWWNQIGKEFAITTFSDEIMATAFRHVKNGKFVQGSMSTTRMVKFAQAGIDKGDWVEIARLHKKYGQKEGGLHIPNIDKWRGKDGNMLPMAHKLMSILKKEADTVIVTPSKGDLPLWMRTHVGSMVGQFKSFGFASTNKILLPSIQRIAIGDPNAIAGFTSQMMLGVVAYGLKMHLQGREPSTEMNVLVREAIDRSGYFGIFTDINAIMEKSSKGTLGIAGIYNLFGIESPELSRYYTRPLLGDIVGPSGGTLEDFKKMFGSLASGEYTRGDISAWRRMMPYQNLWYLRNTLNSAQEVATEGLVK